MKRIIIFISMISLLSSCGNENNNVTLDYQTQKLGLTSIHNARQLGGYVIGNKQIKQNLLLRTASLATLSADD
ncbi:MAG: tyrosine-protein phosphatase, partial [Bacteroidales bacterium]|nr:tyrosine-protein phosphatase [Bacteroidales bacterium]